MFWKKRIVSYPSLVSNPRPSSMLPSWYADYASLAAVYIVILSESNRNICSKHNVLEHLIYIVYVAWMRWNFFHIIATTVLSQHRTLDFLVQRAYKFLGLVEQAKQNILSSEPHYFFIPVHNTVFCCGININGKFNMVSAPQLLVTQGLCCLLVVWHRHIEFDLGRRCAFAVFSVYVLAYVDRGLVMVWSLICGVLPSIFVQGL
jgi:hypothetical protein